MRPQNNLVEIEVPNDELDGSLASLGSQVPLDDRRPPLPELVPPIRLLPQQLLLLFLIDLHALLLIELILNIELDLRQVDHLVDIV